MKPYGTLGTALKMGVKVCYRPGGWIAQNLATGGAIDLPDLVDSLILLNREPVFRFEDQAVIEQLMADDSPRLAATRRLLQITQLGPQRYAVTAGEILEAAKRVFDQVDSPREITLESVLASRFLPSSWPHWRHPIFSTANKGWADLLGDDLAAFRTASWVSRSAAARSISLRQPQSIFSPYRGELKQDNLVLHLSWMDQPAWNRHNNSGVREHLLVVPDDPSVPPVYSSFPGLKEDVGSYYLGRKPSGASIYFLGAEPAVHRLKRTSWHRRIHEGHIPVDVISAAA